MSAHWPEWLIGLALTWDVGLRITAVLSVTWMIHLALAGRNPRWRALLWRLTAIGLVTIPLLAVAMPKIQLSVEPPDNFLGSSAAAEWGDPWLTSAQFDATEAMTTMDEPINLASVDLGNDSLSKRAIAPTEKPNYWALAASYKLWWALWACWGLVACVLAFRWCAAQWRVRGKLADCVTAPESCLRALHRTSTKLGCSRQIGLRVSAEADVPFVTGLFRPVIVLPARMADPSSASELPAILAHEMAHHKSQDLVWMGLLHWVEILLWFHPLVWRISKVHSIACEEVADAVAANLVGDVTRYSGTLARVALLALAPPPVAATIPMARSPEIVTRLARLKHGLSFSPLARRSVFASVAFATVTLLAVVGFELVLAESNSIAADEARTIEFPKNYSVGIVLIALEEEPSWLARLRSVNYPKPLNWGSHGVGQGTVTIPASAKVKLFLNDAGTRDMSWTSRLGPDDLHTLHITGRRFGDAQLAHLGRLKGLEELWLKNVQVSDRGLRSLETMKSLKLLWLEAANLTNAGLKYVGQLESLEVLGIRLGKWDDAGLAHLSQLYSLREFHYSSQQIRGPGLEHIARLPSLRYVASGGPEFTDQHLAYWSRAKSLTGLHIQLSGITDEDLGYLENLKELEHLDLWHTGITDAGLVHLKPLKKLRHLRISAAVQRDGTSQLAVPGMAQLAELLSLEYLDLPSGGMTDEHCEYVSRLKNLKHLRIGESSDSPITDAGLKHLAKLKNLESLYIGGAGITDDGLAHIGSLPQLKHLHPVYVPRVTNNGFAKLGALKSLETLFMPFQSRVTISALSRLNGLSNLKYVIFGSTKPPRRGEKALDISGLTQLEILHLPPVRDKDLACLSDMKNLRWLRVVSPATDGRTARAGTVGKAGIAHLANVTSLEQLDIGSKALTDDGLVHLIGLHQLNNLNVYGRFTDEAVVHLEEMKGLKALAIYSEKKEDLSAQAKQRLKRNLPNLDAFCVDGWPDLRKPCTGPALGG
jgi:beta-lactamase regulating signal transducer with metallopeptidase domain